MYNKLKTICENSDVTLLYVFGSQKNKTEQILLGNPVLSDDPMTDIDIGVVFDRLNSEGLDRAKLYSRLYNELEEIFLPFKLDLVFLQENHSIFQAEALKGICVYYKDLTVKDLYEEDVLRRACDFTPYLDLYYRDVLEGY